MWSTVIPADAVPGAALSLRLIMTKFRDPSVQVGYEITLEPVP